MDYHACCQAEHCGLADQIAGALPRLPGRKRCTEGIGLDHYLVNVVALGALKRAEVETQACGHDASEHHVSMALGASRAMNEGGDVVEPRTKFWHDASLKTGGAGAQHSLSPVVCPWGSAVMTTTLGFGVPVCCSKLISLPEAMKFCLMRPFSVQRIFEKLIFNGRLRPRLNHALVPHLPDIVAA
jgi:hypothetical protein